MGEVIDFPKKYEPLLTYEQLGFRLGLSRRKLNYLRARGMPDAGFDPQGRRVFNVVEVTRWLAKNGAA